MLPSASKSPLTKATLIRIRELEINLGTTLGNCPRGKPTTSVKYVTTCLDPKEMQ